MELQRKQDLSLLYWLTDLLEDSPFINITSEYTEAELTPPSIAIETGVTDGDVYELGNRDILLQRVYYVDIYAQNISQRNDYAYKIFNELKGSALPVYDYDEGFPPDVSPTQLGNLLFKKASITPIHIDSKLVEKMYYRSVVKYIAIYETRT